MLCDAEKWVVRPSDRIQRMSIFTAILLALIEGITEFLSISSTGHMILVAAWLPTDDSSFTNAYLVMIQLPAILAVVVYFWDRVWPFRGMSLYPDPQKITLWTRILVAFLPAAVLGALFDDLIDYYLFRPGVVAAALFVGGILILILEQRDRAARHTDAAALPIPVALAIGLFQCLAMVPGTSRSAATIIGAMILGANRATAAEFSFFLAMPTMAGAAGLKTLKAGLDFTGAQWGLLLLGSAVSFLTAYAVVALFMRYIRRHTFIPFAWYRIVLAGLVALLLIWR